MRFSKSHLFIALVILVNLVGVYLNQSTYDSGDSILHYLQAKSSWKHPMLFMDHWAKPVFVLLASPFAQFDFMGMKLFNTLCVLASVWVAAKIAKKQGMEVTWPIWILALSAPHVFLVQSSGLTELLIALALILSIYWVLEDKWMCAGILISFTPFIRSEGWILILVFAAIFQLRKQWKAVPMLLAGSVIYGLIGLPVHGDFLWMFHHNPYSGVEEKYGSGDVLHFVNQLPYLLGWPAFGLMLIGLGVEVKRWVDSKFQVSLYQLLIVGSFLAILVAHTMFWSMGIFHSFGLKRVLIAVFPSMILLALRGWDPLLKGVYWMFHTINPLRKQENEEKKWYTMAGWKIVLVFMVVIFPFTGNKAGYEMPDDFSEDASQLAARKAVNWLNTTDYRNNMVCIGNYYFGELLHRDIYNRNTVLLMEAVKDDVVPSGTIVLWDDYFAVSDKDVQLTDLDSASYQFLKAFKGEDRDYHRQVHVYLKR